MRLIHVLIVLLSYSACSKEQATVAEIVSAGPGPVTEVVEAAKKRANKEHRKLIVYVSAGWCEPCERFQAAVARRELPTDLGHLRFLKFDHDVDDARLSEAGYGGNMLPRFVVPGVYGRPTERRFDGSIKGGGAVDNIVPRLRALMTNTP